MVENAGMINTLTGFMVFSYKINLKNRRTSYVVICIYISRDRFPVVSLDFSVTYTFRPYRGPRVESVPSENEYQEHFLGIKAAGAWG
jgi:hypothetical protein